MSDVLATDLTPAERVDDVPRVQRALRRAIQDALQRHKRDRDPVAIWKDGRVVWIPPEEIPDPSLDDEVSPA
jgi:hypothetical protein